MRSSHRLLATALAAAAFGTAPLRAQDPTEHQHQLTAGESSPSPTLSEQMREASNPLDAWGFDQLYNPAIVNMRVSSNLQMIINSYDFGDPWLDGPFFTGTWGGLREQLFNTGIEFTGGYIGNPFWNPVGGTTERAVWHHYVSGGLNFDFEKLAGLKGSSFFVTGRWRGGGYLSQYVGITGLFEPSAYVGSEGWRLTQMYYRQVLLDDRMEFRVGRLIACDPFADNPITYVFINDAIDANVVGIADNIPFSTGTVTWGAFMRTWPREDTYIQVGVYNNPPTIGQESNNGLDFGFTPEDGVLVMAEACWDPTEHFDGLPGSYLFGGYVMTAPDLINYATGASNQSVWGLYAAATQMVYSETPETDQQGLSLFVTASGAPPAENQLSYYMSAGAVYVGAIPGRDNDQLGLAYSFAQYSGDYNNYLLQNGQPGQDSQSVIELTYAYSVTPWLVIQPDVQYFFNPAANDSVQNALVLGVQIAVTF